MKVTQNFLLFENCLQQQQNEVFNQVLLKLRKNLVFVNELINIKVLLYNYIQCMNKIH